MTVALLYLIVGFLLGCLTTLALVWRHAVLLSERWPYPVPLAMSGEPEPPVTQAQRRTKGERL